ncbi:MAG: hypothetical protein JO301_09215 [Chitinophagaceae bacterium]|nr:hypothetical protein [Chitinophagaceae bacterium]
MQLSGQDFHKTRIAPTPSGYLHIGNILSFALTARLAEQTSAEILLRIDDLDQQRAQPEYIQDIFDTLGFLQLPWREGSRNTEEFMLNYSQALREPIYEHALQELVKTGEVFGCSCSRSEINAGSPDRAYPGTCRHKNIPLDQPGISWRLRTDAGATVTVKNLDGTITEQSLPAVMQDFVVRKKDGHASYQLASFCDDVHYGIDLIVRGQDLYDSTLAQLYLAKLLNNTVFAGTVFYHHPLLLNNGRKLSKSAGDTSVQYLRRQGWDARKIYRYIGEMAGLREVTSDWGTLGAAYFKTPS